MSFLAAALFAIASRLLWANLVALVESMRPGAALDLVTVTGLHAATTLALVLLVARLYARELPLRTLLALRSTGSLVLFTSCLAGATAEVPVAYAERFWAARFPLTESEQAEVSRMISMETTPSKIIVFVCIAVLWPVMFELFFRGALFGRLRLSRDATTSTLSVAAFYALSLGTPRALPSALFLGLATTALRSRSGSTVTALGFHVAFMSAAVIREVRGPSDEALGPRHVAIAASLLVVVLGALLFGLRTDSRVLEARAADEAG